MPSVCTSACTRCTHQSNNIWTQFMIWAMNEFVKWKLSVFSYSAMNWKVSLVFNFHFIDKKRWRGRERAEIWLLARIVFDYLNILFNFFHCTVPNANIKRNEMIPARLNVGYWICQSNKKNCGKKKMHNSTSDDNNESIPFDIEKRGYRNCLKRYSMCGNQNESDRMEWKKNWNRFNIEILA